MMTKKIELWTITYTKGSKPTLLSSKQFVCLLWSWLYPTMSEAKTSIYL